MQRRKSQRQTRNPGWTQADLDRCGFATPAFWIHIGLAHTPPTIAGPVVFTLACLRSSLRIRWLVFLMPAFTIAHTATLGRAAFGMVSARSSVIAPLMVSTIAAAAPESIHIGKIEVRRPLLAFKPCSAGLAGTFGDPGLPDGLCLPALTRFDQGIGPGRLAVIGMAFATCPSFKRVLSRAVQMKRDRLFRVWPVSAMTGGVRSRRAFERVFLKG